MPQQKRSLALLVGLLGVILLAGACHKKKPAAGYTTAAPSTVGANRQLNGRAQHD